MLTVILTTNQKVKASRQHLESPLKAKGPVAISLIKKQTKSYARTYQQLPLLETGFKAFRS